MKLFVYEFVTGGGTWGTTGSIEPPGSLLAEGKAMAEAVVADLTSVGIHVTAMLDVRLKRRVSLPCHLMPIADSCQEQVVFGRLVQETDATLLIAPEIGGALLDRCRRVEQMGGRLVSPGSPFVAIAGNKQATAELLSQHRVPVPKGMRLDAGWSEIGAQFFPAVLKPCDGAGSWLVRRLDNPQQLEHAIQSADRQHGLQQHGLRLEQFIPGLAASVSVLCGPAGNFTLMPCAQLLGEGGFDYLGGKLPLSPRLTERARSLAVSAIAALPPTVGYVGVDLILGKATDGSDDYVIEINPRLTTSYVGLRAACRENLAAAMLAWSSGRSAALSFHDQPLEFRADGTVWETSGVRT